MFENEDEPSTKLEETNESNNSFDPYNIQSKKKKEWKKPCIFLVEWKSERVWTKLNKIYGGGTHDTNIFNVRSMSYIEIPQDNSR